MGIVQQLPQGGLTGHILGLVAPSQLGWVPNSGGGGGAASQFNVALINGDNPNVTPLAGTTGTSLLCGGYTGPISLGGLNPTSVTAGQPADLTFTVPGLAVVVKNNDPSATAGWQITTPTGQDFPLPPGQAPTCKLLRNGTSGWILQTGAATSITRAKLSDFANLYNSATNDWAPALAAAIAYLGPTGGELDITPSTTAYQVLSETAVNYNAITIRGHGNPVNGTGVVLKAGAAMRSVFNVTQGYCHFADLQINANRNANYGFYRNNEAFTEYSRVVVNGAVFDGWHTGTITDAGTLSAVVQTGTAGSPSATVAPSAGTGILPFVTLAYTISTGGALGTAQATLSINGGAPSAPYVIPTDGKISPCVGGTIALGVLFTFAAGNYNVGTVYTVTLTGTVGTNNDFSLFRNCMGNNCGIVYGSNNVQNMLGATQYGQSGYEGTFGTASLTGTLTTTAGSQTFTGIGTNFLTSGARFGDYLRFGFPPWAPSTNYRATVTLSETFTLAASATVPYTGTSLVGNVIPGDFIQFSTKQAGVYYQIKTVGASSLTLASPYTGTTGTDSTGIVASFVVAGFAQGGAYYLYVWRPYSGTTSGTAVSWPLRGSVAGSSPVGTTVSDGGIQWVCYMSALTQIQNVGSNFQIIGNTYLNAEMEAFVGLDYAIAVGSGSFDQNSGNTSRCKWEGGSFIGNAAAGIFVSPLFGDTLEGTQCTANGICGFSLGGAAAFSANTRLGGYSEGNFCTDIIANAIFGLTVDQHTFGSAYGVVYNPGTGSFGVQIGYPLNNYTEVISPIGGAGCFSSVPVTSTELSYPFVVNSASQFLTTSFGPVAGSTLPCSTEYMEVGLASGDVTLTTAPTIASPTLPTVNNGFYSQRLVIYNTTASNGTLYLPDHTQVGNQLYLDQPLVGIAPGAGIELVYFWDLGAWYQVSRAAQSDNPLAVKAATPVTTTSGSVALTVAQYCKSILVIAASLAGNLNVVFPNQLGAWDVDVSGLTLNGYTISFTSGSTTVVAATPLLATDTLWRVVCRGTSTIAVQT